MVKLRPDMHFMRNFYRFKKRARKVKHEIDYVKALKSMSSPQTEQKKQDLST